MLDDVAMSIFLDDYYQWKNINENIIDRPYWKVFEDDGDVKPEENDGSFDEITGDQMKWRVDKKQLYKFTTFKHFTGFQSYDIHIRETIKAYKHTDLHSTSYYLKLTGSLKKNHFVKDNLGHFTFKDLQQQIALIEKLGLDASKVKIDNLAPSVSIELPSPVLNFLDEALISYRGKAFKAYDPDKSGKTIGYYCPQTQGDIKIYDKSHQLGVSNNVMQFEQRFFKMQKLKDSYGIEYLSDLKNYGKVNSLLKVLLQTWDDILLYDNTIDVNDERLNPREKEMVQYGYSCKYWQRLKKETTSSTYANRVQEFRALSKRYGSNSHYIIRELIINEWNLLMSNWTKLPSVNNFRLDNVTSTVRGNIIQIDNYTKELKITNMNLVDGNKKYMTGVKRYNVKAVKLINRLKLFSSKKSIRSIYIKMYKGVAA